MCFSSSIICLLIVTCQGSAVSDHDPNENEGLRTQTNDTDHKPNEDSSSGKYLVPSEFKLNSLVFDQLFVPLCLGFILNLSAATFLKIHPLLLPLCFIQ